MDDRAFDFIIFVLGLFVGVMFGFGITTAISPFNNFEDKVERGYVIYNEEVYLVKKVPNDRLVQGNHTINSNE